MEKDYLSRAHFRFYEELNDFLPAHLKKTAFIHSFFGKPTVKDAIESLGVPHTEIDLILINGSSVDFDHHVKDGDIISIYPSFESLDISPLIRLRPKPLRHTKFIADVHLGKLVKYLRILGFDTYFDPKMVDEAIIEVSLKEKRIVLTRDLGILKNRKVTHGYWIRSTDPKKQIAEVIKRFDLKENIHPLTRCLECNSELVSVPKNEVEAELLPETREAYTNFYKCLSCQKIFWEGSHYDNMKKFIKTLS